MSDEFKHILELAFAGGGGVTIWKLVENWQKHRQKKDIKKDELEEDKDKIIRELRLLIEALRDQIKDLEVDNGKLSTWIQAFREELERGTLADKIKELADE